MKRRVLQRLRRSTFGLVIWWVVHLAACSDDAAGEGEECDSSTECEQQNGSLICVASRCQSIACDISADCPRDAACLEDLCVPVQCTGNEDCDSGEGCFEGICFVDICDSALDCGPEESCFGTPPVCQPPPEACGSDTECPLNQRCQQPEGVCVTGCEGDEFCPGGELCMDGFCRPPCDSNSGCPVDRVCLDGRCIEPEDCEQRECPPRFPFLQPVSCECVMCLADSDCDPLAGEVCAEDGTCTFCPVKTQDPERCFSQGLILREECCVECIEDVDCSLTADRVCRRGRCESVDLGQCQQDGDCAGGEVCRAEECVPAGSLSSCELQADCPPGEGCFPDGRCRVEALTCEGCTSPGRCITTAPEGSATCLGCTSTCDTAPCGAGEVCLVPEGALEGYCADADFVPDC